MANSLAPPPNAVIKIGTTERTARDFKLRFVVRSSCKKLKIRSARQVLLSTSDSKRLKKQLYILNTDLRSECIRERCLIKTIPVRVERKVTILFLKLEFWRGNFTTSWSVLQNCRISGKECWPWADAANCRSGPTLFSQGCLCEYIAHM